MTQNNFEKLSLHPSILRAIKEKGYTDPSEIQAAAIPVLLEGQDIVATAQTGTGKTAAFSLPILHLLHSNKPRAKNKLRALILTPTRELAIQIDASLAAYGRYTQLGSTVVVGGVSQGAQVRALRKNPAILVATPGRLQDLINQRFIDLSGIEIFVLDEADRMFDMGFINDIRRISAMLTKDRQTMLFSATISPQIAELARSILRNPAKIEVTPPASISSQIKQQVLFVSTKDKTDLLLEVLKGDAAERTLIFTRTKHKANRLAQQLVKAGISADAIHSNKSQGARQKALNSFDRGKTKVLVATDIVARGIDVSGISHVINYELPQDVESYVHRIGRTARAGKEGIALTFCDSIELSVLRQIERLTKETIEVFADHSFHSASIAAAKDRTSRPSAGRGSRGRGRSSSGRRSFSAGRR